MGGAVREILDRKLRIISFVLGLAACARKIVEVHDIVMIQGLLDMFYYSFAAILLSQIFPHSLIAIYFLVSLQNLKS